MTDQGSETVLPTATFSTPVAAAPSFRDALEFAAKHFSSDWPERCQSIVLTARAALSAAPNEPCPFTNGDCKRDDCKGRCAAMNWMHVANRYVPTREEDGR